MRSKRSVSPRAGKALMPRIRVLLGDEIALGPGKADLLALIARTGSIARAAEQLGMSYMRAWSLIRTMNRCFREPLVATERGGETGGGARLTASGRRALALYEGMSRKADVAARPDWTRLRRLLR